jgi:hypothetical protein
MDQTKVKSALDDLFAEVSAADGANLALLFSLPHDFPTEWSAFVNGTGDLSVTIRRDYFPYFVHGKDVTLNEFQLYAPDVTKPDVTTHHAFDDPAARTTDLRQSGACTLAAPEDGPGPTQVLTRTPGKQVFLIIRYSI